MASELSLVHQEKKNHVVFIPISSISHIRPLLQFSFNVLLTHPSVVSTFLISSTVDKKVKKEVSIQPPELIEKIRGRWQIVTIDLDIPEGGPPFEDNTLFLEGFTDFYKGFLNKEAQDGLKALPCAIVFDMFRAGLRELIVSASAEMNVPRPWSVSFIPVMAVALYTQIVPESQGGSLEHLGDRYQKYLAEGLDAQVAATKAYRNVQGRLLCSPDLPDMYDYEFTPQAEACDIDQSITKALSMMFDLIHGHEAAIITSARELDGAACSAFAELLGFPVLAVGPQFSETVWEVANRKEVELDDNTEGNEIVKFLDQSLKTYGPNSAAYVSLGTNFWPSRRPELITVIIESLLSIDPPIPFVFASAYRDSKEGVHPDLKKKVHDSGRGLIVNWAPQLKVLEHEAVGIFLTHCGLGSTTESIVAGVPIIALPFVADQPGLAAYFTQVRKHGIRLDQFSTGCEGLTLGNGVKVIGTEEAMYQELSETWKRMRGEEGEVFRKNVVETRDILRSSQLDGESRKGMEDFARFLIPRT